MTLGIDSSDRDLMTSEPARLRPVAPFDAAASALRTVAAERAGLDALSAALADGLGAPFRASVDAILAARGRVIVAGMGKSGHVGRKIAATLASTGTPAYFVHPAEASHGDLGMIMAEDVILALSWSGETTELGALIDYAARFSVTLIAVTSETTSTLAQAADHALVLPKAGEACPNGLAPTTSTTIQMALGDALAVALLEARGFSARDFRVFHPGGKLGAGLRLVRDLMHVGAALPLVARDTLVSDAILTMSEKRFGCVIVTEADGRLAGIFTDGDLRRATVKKALGVRVDEVMTAGARTIAPDALAAEAMEMIEAGRFTVLIVAEAGRPVGILHLHDLLQAGVV